QGERVGSVAGGHELCPVTDERWLEDSVRGIIAPSDLGIHTYCECRRVRSVIAAASEPRVSAAPARSLTRGSEAAAGISRPTRDTIHADTRQRKRGRVNGPVSGRSFAHAQATRRRRAAISSSPAPANASVAGSGIRTTDPLTMKSFPTLPLGS